MIVRTEFQDLVTNAYQYLYDFVQLRNHPLTQLLIHNETVNSKERGWQIHRLLLDIIEELYPGASAPPFSKEWRRHRLMLLRYIEALQPQAVAGQLSISRRQYYREHAIAIEGIANILWERFNIAALGGQDTIAPVSQLLMEASTNHEHLVQSELARISQHDTQSNLEEVIERVIHVLERVLEERQIVIETSLPADMPSILIGYNLLRQAFFSILGYFTTTVSDTTLCIHAHIQDETVYVQIETNPVLILEPDSAQAQLGSLSEILGFVHTKVDLLFADTHTDDIVGFGLLLSAEYDCTVLIIDDNEDTLALYQRYLTANRYRIITSNTAQGVLEMARKIHPDIIVLDLMMPDQDGWDILQLLANQPDTVIIPIVICSVLKQKQLALSLGAAAFLAKPFTEAELLSTLSPLC
jgi:CheY-like chemotaxis protein